MQLFILITNPLPFVTRQIQPAHDVRPKGVTFLTRCLEILQETFLFSAMFINFVILRVTAS